ncbi:MAG: glycerol-3-phosphate 1-O-acyltransferase PlsY [Alphaproteobacteria bacterium]|nr:glycerol-3-phosphate 1-O-acyltransferase PlsY [Alphaproteobacteria bacterium]
MISILTNVLILLIAYLLGSIPFGLLVSWLFKLEDPRTVGSKNIGATNVLRSGNKRAALLTFLLDGLKGSAAMAMALIFDPTLAPWAGILVVIGHIWPIWLRFQGGKGVATTFGALLILSWPVGVTCLVTWAAVATTTRYSSLAALLSIVLSPLYSLFLKREDLALMCLGLGALILISHRQNISRLITGKETKIGNNTPQPPSL